MAFLTRLFGGATASQGNGTELASVVVDERREDGVAQDEARRVLGAREEDTGDAVVQVDDAVDAGWEHIEYSLEGEVDCLLRYHSDKSLEQIKGDIVQITGVLAGMARQERADGDAAQLVRLRKLGSKVLQAYLSLPPDAVRGRRFHEEVMQVRAFLQREVGASPDLYTLSHFADLSDQLAASLAGRATELLLQGGGEELTLVEKGSIDADVRPQRDVLRDLGRLSASLDQRAEVDKLSVEQLLGLKFLLNQLISNYYVHQPEKKIQVMDAILTSLLQSRSKVNRILAGKEDLSSLGSSEASRNLSYFTDGALRSLERGRDERIFQEARHIEKLQAHERDLDLYQRLFAAEGSCRVAGAEFICASDDESLRVYRGRSADAAEKLFVICQGGESLLSHYNPTQCQSHTFGLQGHSSCLARGKALWGKFQLLCEEQRSTLDFSSLPIVTMGFGIDGAAAQLLAFQFAKENTGSTTDSFTLGVPNYLIDASAWEVGSRENYYGIDFQSMDDWMLKASALSSVVAERYWGRNALVYPLTSVGISSVLDLTGHHAGDYAFHLRNAARQAMAIFDWHREEKILVRLLAEGDGCDMDAVRLHLRGGAIDDLDGGDGGDK